MARRAAAVVGVVAVSALLLLVCRGARESKRPRRGGVVPAPELVRGERVARVVDPSLGPLAWLYEPGVPGRRIAGVVVDEGGQGVAGARVELRLAAAPSVELGQGAVAVSGEDGRFDLGVQAVAGYSVGAVADGYVRGRVELLAKDPLEPTEDVKVKLRKCGELVDGVVVEAGTQRPIAFARLSGGGAADEAGRFRLCLGDSTVVSAEGFVGQDVTAERLETESVVALTRGRSLRGRVVDAEKRPVVGALVWVRREGAIRISPGASAVTDADGAFAIDAVTLERAQVSATVESLGSATADLAPGTAVVEMELRLDGDCRRIAGTVLLEGKPYVGATLAEAHGVYAQADGTFVWSCAPTRPFLLTVPGLRVEPPVLVPAGRADIDSLIVHAFETGVVECLVLGADPASVSVRISDGPLRGLADHRVMRPDASGRFRVIGVKPGRHSVQARTADGSRVAEAWIDVGSGTQVPLVLRLVEPAVIEGMVHKRDGTPLEGVFVTADGPVQRNAVSGPDGGFRVTGLMPGTYELKALVPARDVPRATVSVAAGDTQQVRLMAARSDELDHAKCELDGVVVGEDGQPVGNAVIELAYEHATSDGLGRFKISTSRYAKLVAHAPDGRVSEPTACRDAQRLVVKARSTLDVRVGGCTPPIEIQLAARYRPPIAVTVWAPDGRVAVQALGLGEHEVSARCAAGNGRKTVVLGGQPVSLELPITPRADVYGVIRGAPPDILPQLSCAVVEPEERGSGLFPVGHNGAFLVERVPAGDVLIECKSWLQYRHEWRGAEGVFVRAGETASIEVWVQDEAD